MTRIIPEEIQKYLPFIKALVKKGGPDENEYELVGKLMNRIGELRLNKVLLDEDILMLHKEFEEAMTTTKTIQGFGAIKPHGYPGDYEIIDKIYQQSISEDDHLKKWDYYFHNQAAVKAVRNRKKYFKSLLKSKPQNIRVLNLASGPCRDIAEYMKENPDSHIHFDCVELDINAINFAKSILKEHQVDASRVNFINKNVFRFIPDQKYDLIWSAGLFDYFDDRLFSRITSRFLNYIKPKGEVIIGNFNVENPTRHYMEFAFWVLHHRTAAGLIDCAMNAGVKNRENIKIEAEKEGINFFMRIADF